MLMRLMISVGEAMAHTRQYVLSALFAVLLLVPGAAQAANVSPEEASRHVGETATVCGTVASAHFADRARGRPTFLNLDRPYPSEIFTVVIWGDNRAAFGSPDTQLMGKRICTTGVIQLFRGRPEMVVRSPAQLTQQ